MELELLFSKLHDDVKLPWKATETAACYDTFCPEDVVLQPKSVTHIPLNFAVQCPEGFKLCVYNRSGLGKKGLIVSNGVGIVDQDYRGNVGVLFYNSNDEPYEFKKGDRICQIALEKVYPFNFKVVDYSELTKTERDTGGFGHSGK